MTGRGIQALVILAALGLLASSGCGSDPIKDPGESVPCSISWSFDGHTDEHFLHWSGDGAHLVFDMDDTIWTLNIEDVRLRKVADVDLNYDPTVRSSWGYKLLYGFHGDVSPDGSRIVYSTCEYRLNELPSLYRFDEEAGDLENTDYYRYELAMVHVDGTERKRLTETDRFDGYPAWSPSGTHVAFAANRNLGGDTSALSKEYYGAQLWPDEKIQLAIMAVETGDLRWLESTSRVALYPPVWSHDSQRLAFIANEGEGEGPTFRRVLHTIGVDGTELIKIGETTAAPTWSPDSEELAFAAVKGGEAVLYAVSHDGTGNREVWRSRPEAASTPISQVAWSPDGSELLFVSDRVYVVDAGGSDMRPLSPDLPPAEVSSHPDGPRDIGAIRAAWSPDGSRVAVYYPRRDNPGATRALLATVAVDGTGLQTLAAAHKEGPLRALNAPQTQSPVDLAACSAGVVVSEPEENPGLVRDCEVLLSIRHRLAGDSGLDWNESTPIGEWEEVELAFEPRRVVGLSFRDTSLQGDRTELSGTLPPELGQLSELRRISMPGNNLNGSIPPELGNLSKLRELSLQVNFLTGPIPPELGRLTQLERLDLRRNFLVGGIPPQLGRLVQLQELLLSGNPLGGSIPPELEGLVGLSHVELNRHGGCIPVELPEIWVRASGLERCAE